MNAFIISFLTCLLSLPVLAASNHFFFTGVVSSVSSNSITVNDRQFMFAPKVEVVVQERAAQGNFQEKKSRMGSVSAGTPVIVRIEGAMVNQIIIEEWKR
jgi:Ni,Fe-hydrogenase III small subunit